MNDIELLVKTAADERKLAFQALEATKTKVMTGLAFDIRTLESVLNKEEIVLAASDFYGALNAMKVLAPLSEIGDLYKWALLLMKVADTVQGQIRTDALEQVLQLIEWGSDLVRAAK